MWGYRFINEMCQHWQDKPWMKLDDVTPYNIRHRRQRGVLECVGEFHFRRYCGPYWSHGAAWEQYKSARKRKLYWKLHPEYKDW